MWLEKKFDATLNSAERQQTEFVTSRRSSEKVEGEAARPYTAPTLRTHSKFCGFGEMAYRKILKVKKMAFYRCLSAGTDRKGPGRGLISGGRAYLNEIRKEAIIIVSNFVVTMVVTY